MMDWLKMCFVEEPVHVDDINQLFTEGCMQKIIGWIKANKAMTVLLLVLGWLVWSQQMGNNSYLMSKTAEYAGSSSSGFSLPSAGIRMMDMGTSGVASAPSVAQGSGMMPVPDMEAPPVDSSDRMVVRDTSMSLLVEDVAESINRIQSKTEALDGFLVNSNVSLPEGAASGSITVRVPEQRRTEAIEAFRGFGVRVVSENVSGRDVTDQYEDIESRLAVLAKTKDKYESILNDATRVQDLLQVQRELVSLQQQIDSLKGRQQYLEQTAKLTRISVYLSTDELALPYTPDQVWRPAVVFKNAVRSMIGSVRKAANGVIWLGVYAPIWVPVGLGVWWLSRRKNKAEQV